MSIPSVKVNLSWLSLKSSLVWQRRQCLKAREAMLLLRSGGEVSLHNSVHRYSFAS